MVSATELLNKWKSVGTRKIKSTNEYNAAVQEADTRSRTRSSGSSSKSMSSKKKQSAPIKMQTDMPVETSSKAAQRTQSRLNTNVQVEPQTAWEKITQDYDKGNWLTKAYQKIDYGLGGFLPGGISRSLVKAADTELEIPNVQLMTQANQKLEFVKQQEDFSKKSWYEQIGFNYPEEEKIYQERAKEQRIQTIMEEPNIIRQIGTNLGGGFVEGAIPEAKPFNLGNYALIAAAAVLGIMALRKT